MTATIKINVEHVSGGAGEIATAEWAGHHFKVRAPSGHSPLRLIAREMLAAGAPDAPWLTDTLSGPSLRRLAELNPHMEMDPVEQCPVGKSPKKMLVSELRAMGHDPSPLLKVIRAKCKDCSMGNEAEIRRCGCGDCPLWPYRMGTNPFRAAAPRSEAQREVARAGAARLAAARAAKRIGAGR